MHHTPKKETHTQIRIKGGPNKKSKKIDTHHYQNPNQKKTIKTKQQNQ